MASNTCQLVQDVIQLHAECNVDGILALISKTVPPTACSPGARSPIPELAYSDTLALRSLTWPLPRLNDLKSLAGFIKSHNGGHIYSIGCGTGLLEYLLLETMLRPDSPLPLPDPEVNVDDEEVIAGTLTLPLAPTQSDRLSPPPSASAPQVTGIEIDSKWWTSPYAPPKFIDLLYVGETFPTEGPFGSPHDVILFSYFNSMKVFVDYLSRFQGKYVIIIGPNRSSSNKKQYCAPSPLDLRDGDCDDAHKTDDDEDDETTPMEVDSPIVDTIHEPPELPEPSSKRRRSSTATDTAEAAAEALALSTTSQCKIPTEQWALVLYQRFGLEEVDNVAIYSRVQK